MAWIREIKPNTAEGPLARVYRRLLAGSENTDVAHILRVHSLNPAALQTHFAFYRTLMFGESQLTRRQREMIAVHVSHLNECFY